MRAFDSDRGKALVSYLNACRQHGTPGPVLFLGAGASISSGYPSTGSLLSNISKRLGRDVSSLGDLRELLTNQQLRLEIGHEVLGKEPGAGYRFLTQLVRRGYFKHILTTNWDMALEFELRRFFDPEQMSVFSRPLIQDDMLAEIIARKVDKPYLLRLHGDPVSHLIMAPKELLALDESLERQLRATIEERGVVIIGYSMQEIRIVNILNKSHNSWYVEPFSLPVNILQQLSIGDNNVIVGDDALFDQFFQGLCVGVINAELADRRLYDKEHGFSANSDRIDVLVDAIRQGLLADTIPEATIESETINLITRCHQITSEERGRTCLVFIEDPSAPGGKAMFDQILRSPTLRKAIQGHPISIAKIQGRTGTPSRDRIVVEFREVEECQWTDLDNVVIIDSVSFSGKTFIVTQQYLEERYQIAPERVIAAALRLHQRAKDKLQEAGIRATSNRAQTTPRLMSPWGTSRPTSPSPAPDQLKSSFGVHLEAKDFLPDRSVWYIPKPWGDVVAFGDNISMSTRILFLERYQRTSLHYHLLRDELFVSLDDALMIQIWDRSVRLEKHQSLRIPAGVPHRFVALDAPCRILEIGHGQYEQQRDIYRIDDIYDRAIEWESDGLQ